MILEDIELSLQEFDPNVFYGMVDDEKVKKLGVWNYTVFNRVNITYNANKTSASDYFDVNIIRENYVPDGTDSEVIKKLTALNGVKLASKEPTFNYVKKPNTNIVIEMLTISFVRARKLNV